MERGGCTRINLLSITWEGWSNQNQLLRRYKQRYPGRFYTFGCPDYTGLFPKDVADADVNAVSEQLGEQPARLRAGGFDGIKLIESKPVARRKLPFPLNGELYARFFTAAEQEDLPVLWHVGDPECFWDPEAITPWARERGWLYDQPGDPSLESFRQEAEDVLRRHPDLRVIFAHLYFLGDKLDRAGQLLRTFPNVYLDTTPGTQMYVFFNAQRDVAQQFFLEFQDRLIFGTDLGASSLRDPTAWSVGGAVKMYHHLRAYFATDDTMPPDFPGTDRLPAGHVMRGLGLPEEVLIKLFHGNFERLAGEEPARRA